MGHFATGGPVRAEARCHPDGHTLFVGSWDDNVYALDPHTGRYLWHFETGDDIVGATAVSHDGTKIIVGSNDNYVYVVHPTPPSQLLLHVMCALGGAGALILFACWQ